MDDLLREFLTESSESLDTVDNQLVQFEQDPNNAKILDNIFRLVHTIKGTCAFLGLPRLEALAHAGETLMGKFRDGMPVKAEAVTLILSSIDRIKEILGGLEATEAEPEGNDRDLIDQLEAMVEHGMAAMSDSTQSISSGSTQSMPAAAEEDVPVVEAPSVQAAMTEGTLVVQTLERPLRPGEVSLDELERAFRETETEVAAPAPAAKPAAAAPAAEPAEAARKPARKAAGEDVQEGDKIANQSIRVNVDTLEHLMTMVSELVLTRNQLLEISRRNEDTEFKVPLQRLSNVTAELQEGVMKTRMQPIGNAWQKLPRIVRDLSGELGKQIEL
uniref:Hpt domain-containing protein n=1 Tax=Bradyrhizobium elkanii TaxID=29448 RepID=UPI00056DF5B3